MAETLLQQSKHSHLGKLQAKNLVRWRTNDNHELIITTWRGGHLQTASQISIPHPIVISILGAAILLTGISFPAFSQESSSSSHPLTKPMDGSHCGKSPRCFDAGNYTATVTDIIESQTSASHLVRLVVRFENVSDQSVILGYRAHSSFLLDNFRNRYFCCRGAETTIDLSAVGIGTDADGKVDSQFRLQPKQSDSVSFDLWRPRAPDQVASYYDFDVMIDQIDPDSLTVQTHPFVSFRNLQVRDRH